MRAAGYHYNGRLDTDAIGTDAMLKATTGERLTYRRSSEPRTSKQKAHKLHAKRRQLRSKP